MTDIIAPANGEKIDIVKVDSVEHLNTAVQKAADVQKEWIKIDYRQRERKLLKMREYIVINADKIAKNISDCTGKTLNDALITEVTPGILLIGYYVKAARKFLKPRKIKGSNILFFNKRSYLLHEPWGVIGIISPWNYPFAIPLHEIIMALAAGNSVVLKVATQAQPVGDLFKKMSEYADLPTGLLSIVNLEGKISGEAFLNSGIDKLFFTGSVGVGQELVKLSAANLIPLSLELGGNDAMIVCSDANLFRAAGGAVWGGISNCGQSCGGVERIYVMADIYEPFMEELVKIVKNLRQGIGLEADFGSLTTKKQKQTVKDHIDDAINKGAKIRAESPDVEGEMFHRAVVLEDVTHDMDVMKHETFGPVLAVRKVHSEEEAVKMANDSYLGLTASVWTKSRKRAEKLASQLHAGAVTVNDHLMSHGMPETPWGGYKMSSLGRSHGGPGLTEVFQTKVIIYDKTHFLPRNIWWHPYSSGVYDGMKSAVNMLYGQSPVIKIRSLLRLISFYLKQMKK